MPKPKSSKEPTVSKVELDAYYNAGMKEINKTKSERFFTAIFVLLLLMGGSYLVHFIG